MDFKDLIGKLDQLNEAGMTSRKVAGKAYGGAAQHDDEDDEDGEKKAAPAPVEKRGRGRPKKAGGDAQVKAGYGGAKDLQDFMVGNIPKKSKELEKLGKTKHKLSDKEPTEKKKVKESLKDWIAELDQLMEAEQISMEPAKQNTQVIKQGTKTLGTVSNPQLAAQIKQSIGKGEMSLAGTELSEEDVAEGSDYQEPKLGTVKANLMLSFQKPTVQVKVFKHNTLRGDSYWVTKEVRTFKTMDQAQAYVDRINNQDMAEGRMPSSVIKDKQRLAKMSDTEFAEKYGSKSDEDLMAMAWRHGYGKGSKFYVSKRGKGKQGVAEAKNHMDETEYNTYAGWKSACRKAGADKFEGDRDICQAMKDGKGVGEWDGEKGSVYDDAHKKKMNESKETSIKAAHHRGKAHALAKEGYNCRYDEGSEEARMYHEGYKMGLDEGYGVMPMRGVVGEEISDIDNMASFGNMDEEYGMMEDDMEEGNAFTAALARTPKGGKFSVGGKTFRDTSDYNTSVDEMMAFEGWDKQLNALLTEGEVVEEGMSVSVSTGQQGAPDSVSITANDGEADKLLALVKQLGVFGSEDQPSDYGSISSTDTVQQHGDLTVVDDHDGMMALIKKVSGGGMPEMANDSVEDYADEMDSGMDSAADSHEETCEKCGGMAESDHSCDPDKEVVGEEESEVEEAEGTEKSDDEEENDDLEESFANSADGTFESDIDFITKVISGGLNKQKSTGQTTIPVISSQKQRMGSDGIDEGANDIMDWKKLAGLK